MATTPARQRNAVSEGMALGLVLTRHASMPFDKVAVDLPSKGPSASGSTPTVTPRYERISETARNGVWVMTHATESRHVWVLFWDTSGREIRIVGRQRDWNPDDDEDVDNALDMIDGNVPRAGWVALAQDFMGRLSA
jgi:hypothetical protein